MTDEPKPSPTRLWTRPEVSRLMGCGFLAGLVLGSCGVSFFWLALFTANSLGGLP